MWSLETANTIMKRFPDPNSYPTTGWSYPHGHLLEGFAKLREFTGDKDKSFYNYIMNYADRYVGSTGTLGGFSGISMDDMMPGVVICWAYNQTKAARYKTAADKIRAAYKTYPRTSDGAFWHSKSLNGEFWIDGVFMGEMFNIRYGSYVGDKDSCFNEAALQLKLARKHLLKGSTKLLLHGWDETPAGNGWANPATGLSPEVWGEGLGWYANVLVDALEGMPRTNKNYDTLVTHLEELAAGLKNFQDSSGCWWDIVDKQYSGLNWLDVSGTSFFVYMLQKGMDIGILDTSVYNPVVRKGYACLIHKKAVINGSGLVDIDYTCGGLSIQPTFDKYMNCGGPTVGVKSSRWEKNAKEAFCAFFWAVTQVEKPGFTTTAGLVISNHPQAGLRVTKRGSLPVVSLFSGQPESFEARIVAIDGKTVSQIKRFVSAPGENQIAFPVKSGALTSGVYLAVVSVNGGKKAARFNWAQ